MDAVRADRWADAQTQAAASADPVARKLVTYFHVLAPNGGASTAEIANFATANPGWPNPTLLERRREEALANEPDQAVALAQCEQAPLQVAAALLRCAESYTAAGRPDDAAAAVRRAWTGSGIVDPVAEATFLLRWGALLTEADQWARFETLMPARLDAATRQAGRLDPLHNAVAQARLAFRRDDPAAEARLAAVPPNARDQPMLVLDHAAWLRRRDRLAEARDVWLTHGAEAERAVDAGQLGAFWAERNALARRLLRAGDDRGAYGIVDQRGATGREQVLDAEFLAGFIALRRLHDPRRRHSAFRSAGRRVEIGADAEPGALLARSRRRRCRA